MPTSEMITVSSFTSEDRETVLRLEAERIVRENGPSMAKFLAALLDKAAEEVEQDHAVLRG
jgi:phage-related minor tail protein